MTSASQLLDLLLELQALDRVPRLGYSLRGVADPESVSEHSFHLAFLVFSLAKEIPGLDRLRALELALVHDLAEVRTGDLPRIGAGYLPPGAKREAERGAAHDLLAPLGPEAKQLADEYLAGETLEARFVRACDKLQLMIKVAAYDRSRQGALEDFWQNPDNRSPKGRQDAFEPVRALLDELHERRARSTSIAGEPGSQIEPK